MTPILRCLFSFGVGCTNAGGSGQYLIFRAFVVFMQFNPQDMWTICSAGKLPSDAKAIWQTQLNRLCPALMWCPPCFRYWHTGRLRVVGALCSVHCVHCNIMHCISCLAISCIAYPVHSPAHTALHILTAIFCNMCVCALCAYCSIVYIQDNCRIYPALYIHCNIMHS